MQAQSRGIMQSAISVDVRLRLDGPHFNLNLWLFFKSKILSLKFESSSLDDLAD